MLMPRENIVDPKRAQEECFSLCQTAASSALLPDSHWRISSDKTPTNRHFARSLAEATRPKCGQAHLPRQNGPPSVVPSATSESRIHHEAADINGVPHTMLGFTEGHFEFTQDATWSYVAPWPRITCFCGNLGMCRSNGRLSQSWQVALCLWKLQGYSASVRSRGSHTSSLSFWDNGPIRVPPPQEQNEGCSKTGAVKPFPSSTSVVVLWDIRMREDTTAAKSNRMTTSCEDLTSCGRPRTWSHDDTRRNPQMSLERDISSAHVFCHVVSLIRGYLLGVCL